MADLKALIAQREELDSQIKELSKKERAEAVASVRSLIADHKLSQQELFGNSSKSIRTQDARTKVAAKYRDPATGKEWSGRGKAPTWMAGQEKANFLIPAEATA